MNRTEFHAKVAPLDADRLRSVLWNLYFRSSAEVRARIEDALDPEAAQARREEREQPLDAEDLRARTDDFVRLARSGAYMAGTRDVSRKERTRWRFTFRDLVRDAGQALAQPDGEAAEAALETLLELAHDAKSYAFFHSEDPVEAMKLVFSDQVRILWRSYLGRHGFGRFARRAARQLVRWEERYGWTVTGSGATRERETSLASILGELLRGHDAWVTFTDAYLAILDEAAAKRHDRGTREADSWERRTETERRAERLAEWNGRVLETLHGGDAGDRVERLVRHPALRGPEQQFLAARAARLTGNLDDARLLVARCLETLPGHREALTFAREIGATLPPRAAEAARQLDL